MNEQFITIISNFEQSDLVALLTDLINSNQIGQSAIEAVIQNRPIPSY